MLKKDILTIRAKNIGSGKMKHKKRIPLLRMGVLVSLIVLLSIPLLVSYFYLPSHIRIIAGEEHLFNFDIPLKANIIQGDNLIIKDTHNSVVQSGLVDLNQPLYITMKKEGCTDVTLSFLGLIPIKTVEVKALPYEELIPCGQVVGIKVNTAGILVLGVGEFETKGGQASPCKGIIETGDLIISCNGKNLETKEDLRNCVEENSTNHLELKVLRKGVEKAVEVEPVYSQSEETYKIGLWIKDSTQGIGTITYIHPDTGSFGALGHGITDADTHRLIPVKDGELMEAAITRIKKGVKGNPGEISGVIDYDEASIIGEVSQNSPLGIYGKVNQNLIKRQTLPAIPIAFQDQVHEGKASVLIDLTGKGVKEYEVEIQKVSKYSNEPSKSMVIKIIDEELLKLTSGIVQGMSGSPILQDGRLIGAVTHVFIQDPTRGYGIFIENMLEHSGIE